MEPSRSSMELYTDAGWSRQLPATGACTVHSPTSFSTRTVGLCEQFSLIQSLCRHEPRPSPKGAGSGVEMAIIRKPLCTLLPLPWPSPCHIDFETQRLFIDPHTLFPQLQVALAFASPFWMNIYSSPSTHTSRTKLSARDFSNHFKTFIFPNWQARFSRSLRLSTRNPPYPLVFLPLTSNHTKKNKERYCHWRRLWYNYARYPYGIYSRVNLTSALA